MVDVLLWKLLLQYCVYAHWWCVNQPLLIYILHLDQQTYNWRHYIQTLLNKKSHKRSAAMTLSEQGKFHEFDSFTKYLLNSLRWKYMLVGMTTTLC
jgi:hypothetical protein